MDAVVTTPRTFGCECGFDAPVSSVRKVLLIGGASPCALYNEVWQLDLQRLTLTLLRPGPAANPGGLGGQPPQRYEHCAFLPPPQDVLDKIWVFAGANMEGNLNDLWELDVAAEEWKFVDNSGSVPAPRTMHTTTAGKAPPARGQEIETWFLPPATLLVVFPSLQTWRASWCSSVAATRRRAPWPIRRCTS